MNIEVPDELVQQGFSYLLESPVLFGLTVLCGVSGHLIFFMIFTYFSDQDATETYLNTVLGKISLGALLYAVVALPLYVLEYGSISIEYAKLMAIVPSVIMIGLFLQAGFFGIFIYRKRSVSA
ncbi:hypothetical protein [Vibrio lentus]|uniref:hypothetical protein n=1 Tax=Vibrio lentus TaxID=136468 RepID=UPI00178CBAC6|nr:hypothetical protein [Vibrio lentus]MDN3630785.1 hypothetical protein [Vibrio lentus]